MTTSCGEASPSEIPETGSTVVKNVRSMLAVHAIAADKPPNRLWVLAPPDLRGLAAHQYEEYRADDHGVYTTSFNTFAPTLDCSEWVLTVTLSSTPRFEDALGEPFSVKFRHTVKTGFRTAPKTFVPLKWGRLVFEMYASEQEYYAVPTVIIKSFKFV